jgi:Acetoacetate decarboxylase (ADC)
VSRRYDMPALFGSSVMPDCSVIPFAEVVSVSFETSAAAAERLVARFFRPTDPPVVTVTRIDYHDVDYLGGRGYREIVVSIGARHGSDDRPAGFSPVMWVTEPGALISGRELMGFAKLPAAMDPISRGVDACSFQATEYDALLIEGHVSDLRALSDESLVRVNASASEVRTFGWKLIPGDGSAPDVDHAMSNVMRWNYTRAWSGEGAVRFHRPDARAAPLSARVVAALADIPVVAARRAFVAEGSARIDRTATRRLHN